MVKPISISLTVLASAILLAGAGNFPPPDPIARLDNSIQHRFLDARAFGMGRILPNRYHGIAQFQPESAAEQQVVSDLKQKGYQVALFLAGRHVLDTPSDSVISPRYGVQGPAYIANLDKTAGLPNRDDLLAESRKAMQSLTAKDQQEAGYDVRKGDWTIAIRPLRASNETCVRCHTSGFGTLTQGSPAPHLGDALGVAMYVYRRS